jgi:hypothetical protein
MGRAARPCCAAGCATERRPGRGAELLAFGAPNTDNKDAEMVADFWED